MAARGFVHSARALPRVLNGTSLSTDKIRHASECCALTKDRRRTCRLLKFPGLSHPYTRQIGRMASTVAISSDVTGANQSREKSNYEEAVVALNSLQSNAEAIRKSMQHRNESRKHNIPNMVNYLQRAGLSLDDVDKLNVIHVTGTKGKGSTCAFTESILRQYGYKTGIFSSPHLIEARERIRINGRPIDRHLFSTCFWDVFDKLQATKDERETSMPHYFSFLTVMALYVFARERVDVALLEVGIGGQYDSTNVVRHPVVCGVSSLDYDHVNLLGHTLPDIAWHKAGIFKRGAQALTVPQPESAMQVLFNRAQENESPLSIAAPLQQEELSLGKQRQLGIAGRKQLYNAALAVQLCRVWLHVFRRGKQEQEDETDGLIREGQMPSCVSDIPVVHSTGLTRQMIKGLTECQWPGRTQTVKAPGVTYYLDGAHTNDSIQQCVEWFRETADQERQQIQGKVRRVLVFNITGDRQVACLLTMLKECGFDAAAFCPNVVSTIASENIPDQLNLTVEQETMLKKSVRNRETWDQLFTNPANQPASDGQHTSQASQSDAHRQLFPSQPALDSQPQTSPPCNGEITLNSLNGNHPSAANGQNGGCIATPSSVSANFPCIASALQWVTMTTAQEGETAASTSAAAVCGGGGGGGDSQHVQVLVTGSLHLVGGVLELILPSMND